MDTSDHYIKFDINGVCNHCKNFENNISKDWYPNNKGEQKLKKIFDKIKIESKDKEYDCIIGLSGGIDSTYLCLVIKQYNLRVLAVHVDAGWNSELAVSNIEKVIKYCNLDLHTHVISWQDMKDLQLSYLKSGIANQDVPQDHAFFSSLYHFAIKNNIKYIINGGNIATESVFPSSWHHSAMDSINLKAIHAKYGRYKLKNFKTISFFQYYFYYPLIKKMKIIRPLNYINYNKENALKILKEKINFKDYGFKHGESRFTKFFQNYYLPKRFNIDKRRPHYSSLILSGQLTRDQALNKISQSLYSEEDLKLDKIFISKKLGISADQLENYLNDQKRSYKKFSNWDKRYRLMKLIKKIIEKIFKYKINFSIKS
jgi:N-acetyl sugar amidotransferase